MLDIQTRLYAEATVSSFNTALYVSLGACLLVSKWLSETKSETLKLFKVFVHWSFYSENSFSFVWVWYYFSFFFFQIVDDVPVQWFHSFDGALKKVLFFCSFVCSSGSFSTPWSIGLFCFPFFHYFFPGGLSSWKDWICSVPWIVFFFIVLGNLFAGNGVWESKRKCW